MSEAQVIYSDCTEFLVFELKSVLSVVEFDPHRCQHRVPPLHI